MKRLASVFLFLLMAALAFFGILRFARQQAEVKAEMKAEVKAEAQTS